MMRGSPSSNILPSSPAVSPILAGSHSTLSTGKGLAPSGGRSSVRTPATAVIVSLMEAYQDSHSRYSACMSRLPVHTSMAASMPMISSLPTFMERPKAWCGELFSHAARTRSLRPSSRPAHWGPRMILPPL